MADRKFDLQRVRERTRTLAGIYQSGLNQVRL